MGERLIMDALLNTDVMATQTYVMPQRKLVKNIARMANPHGALKPSAVGHCVLFEWSLLAAKTPDFTLTKAFNAQTNAAQSLGTNWEIRSNKKSKVGSQ